MSNSQNGERVVIVHINFPAGKMQEDIHECEELALAAGANIVGVVLAAKTVPEAKYFVGSGKAQEIKEAVLATKAKLIIFNHPLSPAQERNLEKLIGCRVVDRTGLILDIFAKRARSFEGKLQVELAMLKHLSTRLIRGWTHLERQKGGIGLRGPGETQLEVDRRLIKNRIKLISGKLQKIRKQREQGRRARRKAIVPTVALVGYTNAGKSTLFNELTGAGVYVADQLFATLDPTFRKVHFKEAGDVILADTVGFIRHLPHDLIEAFQSTLEEVTEADLLLHIVDAVDEDKEAHIIQVEEVLASIGAEAVPRILVYNKIDLNQDLVAKIERNDVEAVRRVFVSALAKKGLNELLSVIAEALGKEMVDAALILPPIASKVVAKLHAKGFIQMETIDAQGFYHLQVRLAKSELAAIKTSFESE